MIWLTKRRIRDASMMVLPIAFLAACDPGPPSQSEVADKLAAQPVIVELSRFATIREHGRGLAIDLDVMNSKGAITPRGQQYFKEVTSSNRAALNVEVPVAVTVVRMGQNPISELLYDIQFEWKYDAGKFGPVHRALVYSSGTGIAEMRRFDDGWRITAVRLMSLDNSPLDRSETDAIEAIREDVAAQRKKIIGIASQNRDNCVNVSAGSPVPGVVGFYPKAHAGARPVLKIRLGANGVSIETSRKYGLAILSEGRDLNGADSFRIRFNKIRSIGNAEPDNYRSSFDERYGVAAGVQVNSPGYSVIMFTSLSAAKAFRDKLMAAFERWRAECVPVLKEWRDIEQERKHWGGLD